MGLPRSPATPSASLRRFFRPSSSSLLSLLTLLALACAVLFALLCLHMAAEDAASRTKTVVGHNLEPTPWHPFPPDPNRSRRSHPYTLLRCSYLACALPGASVSKRDLTQDTETASCPTFFRSIHKDLEPWKRSRISESMVREAQEHAAMRVVIMGGRRLYVDLYYSCVQSRAMFTVWGLLQLLQRYPGRIPDVDIMFDCMDRPMLNRSRADGDSRPPPPLFRYCTTKDHFDIPFPDWSFWGW